MNVYLDDQRPAPAGWTLVRWPDEAIALLETGRVMVLSLDHDLGDDRRGTGYDVILWIERAVALHGFEPPEIRVHSANPVGIARMLMGVRSIMRLQAGRARGTDDIITAPQTTADARSEMMDDQDLLTRLRACEPFGVPMVQRVTGFGHERALETLERLEARGAIRREEGGSRAWVLAEAPVGDI